MKKTLKFIFVIFAIFNLLNLNAQSQSQTTNTARTSLNFTNGYLSLGMMTCTNKRTYVQKPNGEKVSINVKGSKPWLLTTNNNILYSYYSGVQPPVYTVANGAKFTKTQIDPDGQGGQVRSYIFENIDSDGTRYRISIFDVNPTGVMMETYGGGSPNVLVSVSQCRY